MTKKVISLILTLILSFSLCTTAFAVDNENYNVFYLPVISDKMPENKQVSKVELYVDKETDTAFVDLEDISDLIGATCNFKKDWYDVRRDYTYFKYNSAEDMKLYLSNSSNGLLLLDGKLFESRMINNRWYVDYIKFCDMFGVNLIKVDKATAEIDDLPNYHFNEFENEMNFNENPYYIFMYTGTTLSSLYEKLMKYRSSYFWNYSSWARDDVNFLQKPFYSKYGIASSLVEGSVYSNVVNEWGNWTSKILKEYNSEEQYAETLLNVCNINYSNYSTVDSDSYTKADNFYAFVKNVNKVNKSNKYIKKIIENSDLKDDFPEYLDEIKYFGIFTNVMNTAKASVQAFNDTQNFYNRLNNINQEKVDLLKYSIIDNNKLNSQTRYRNVVNNVLTAVGGRFGSRVILNSLDNPVGLVDSANKLHEIYNDKNAQFVEALNKALEEGTYTISDRVLKKALNSNEKTKMIAIGMSVIDKFMSWAKSSYGGVLKDVQNVYQYYYIEQSILNDLDEKNPEILYNRLVMALQASLCIYNSSEEMVGKSYDQDVIDIANMLETLETGKNNHILNINYYRDPRNNNISDDIRNYILNYQDVTDNNGTVSGKVLTEDNNPIKNAKIEVYTSDDNTATRFGEDECYTNEKGEFSLSMPEGKYLLVVTYDEYDPVNIKDVAVEKNKTRRVDDIYLKKSNSNYNDDLDLTIEVGKLTNDDIKPEWTYIKSLDAEYPIFKTNNQELKEFLEENVANSIFDTIGSSLYETVTGTMIYSFPLDGYMNISFELTMYSSGMPHPQHFNTTYRVDLKEKKLLNIFNLFVNDQETVKKELAEKMAKYAPTDKGSLSINDSSNGYNYIKDSLQFTITKEKLIINFSPYEVGSYLQGYVDVEIPWSDIDLSCNLSDIKTAKSN